MLQATRFRVDVKVHYILDIVVANCATFLASAVTQTLKLDLWEDLDSRTPTLVPYTTSGHCLGTLNPKP